MVIWNCLILSPTVHPFSIVLLTSSSLLSFRKDCIIDLVGDQWWSPTPELTRSTKVLGLWRPESLTTGHVGQEWWAVVNRVQGPYAGISGLHNVLSMVSDRDSDRCQQPDRTCHIESTCFNHWAMAVSSPQYVNQYSRFYKVLKHTPIMGKGLTLLSIRWVKNKALYIFVS